MREATMMAKWCHGLEVRRPESVPWLCQLPAVRFVARPPLFKTSTSSSTLLNSRVNRTNKVCVKTSQTTQHGKTECQGEKKSIKTRKVARCSRICDVQIDRAPTILNNYRRPVYKAQKPWPLCSSWQWKHTGQEHLVPLRPNSSAQPRMEAGGREQ